MLNACKLYSDLQKLYLYTMNDIYDQSNEWQQTLEDIEKILDASSDINTFWSEPHTIEDSSDDDSNKQGKLRAHFSEKELSKNKRLKSDKFSGENRVTEHPEMIKTTPKQGEASQSLSKADLIE
ncbi:hypothetical protein ID47_06435 [Candidatus Paracaedibacter acanthamoebae]|uniref:Uncharacterized protein n=2 Tax=Candidatus Odyssella acanthamoebae TaxID=91604 RepID=A0A077ATG0_9PROT|nr:hypothetical protein ID47_06435 [Candidatus Paracaedibacter acanthamoebae]